MITDERRAITQLGGSAADRLAASPGAGLGLSIVRAVARGHDGDVRAEPRDGGGLVVTVTLPGCDRGA